MLFLFIPTISFLSAIVVASVDLVFLKIYYLKQNVLPPPDFFRRKNLNDHVPRFSQNRASAQGATSVTGQCRHKRAAEPTSGLHNVVWAPLVPKLRLKGARLPIQHLVAAKGRLAGQPCARAVTAADADADAAWVAGGTELPRLLILSRR
jgi:hypothetical protein